MLILELLILKGIILDRLKVDEQSGKATIPVVLLAIVVLLVGDFDLVFQLVESDDIAEQVLEPGSEHITPAIELRLLEQAVSVNLEHTGSAVAR